MLASCAAFAQSVPAAINYQGRLTDEHGQPLPNGTHRVAFRLWGHDNSNSTNNPNHLIWGAEYDVTLINGAFNVILGAPGGITVPGAAVNDIGFAFTDPNRFLGLTLTRLADGSTIAAVNQREIQPRQQILSAPYALRAESARVADSVLPQSITGESLLSGAVSSNALADGAVNIHKLAPILTGTNVPIGGLAMSRATDTSTQISSTSFIDVPNLEVTIETAGRPVDIFLGNGDLTTPNSAATGPGMVNLSFIKASYVGSAQSNCSARLVRNALLLQEFFFGSDAVAPVHYPPSSVRFIDNPPPGRHTYRIQAAVWGDRTRMDFYNVKLYAREL